MDFFLWISSSFIAYFHVFFFPSLFDNLNQVQAFHLTSFIVVILKHSMKNKFSHDEYEFDENIQHKNHDVFFSSHVKLESSEQNEFFDIECILIVSRYEHKEIDLLCFAHAIPHFNKFYSIFYHQTITILCSFHIKSINCVFYFPDMFN